MIETGKRISIHAPPRGATTPTSSRWKRKRNFNSRPSARGDITRTPLNQRKHLFQFTPLREGRPRFPQMQHLGSVFQFTPLREGRLPKGCRAVWAKTYFNSRPSARGDGPARASCAGQSISIHAPPRGATKSFLQSGESGTISIHAPPRGATIMRLAKQGKNVISIHAPPRGATCGAYKKEENLIFQFTPLREGRRGQSREFRNRSHFNSRPSARGDTECHTMAQADFISIHAPPRGATCVRCCVPACRIFQFTPLREGRRIIFR